MNKAIFLPLAMLLLPLVRAGDYGYEYLDGGDVLKAWNPKYDYYFDTDTAIQFTNHYEEYWSKNWFCLGYKGTDWEYKCTNDLNNFNWNIDSDNSTYWRATGWKDVNWKGVDLRIAVRYTLNESQDDLIIEPYVENRDTVNINKDIGFAWHVRNIQVAMNETDNVINLDWQKYFNLSDDLSIFYKNKSVFGEYLIYKDTETGYDWMRLKWNPNLLDYINISSVPSQYNAPVTLMIVSNGLNAGQNKTTKLEWIDAGCKGEWTASTTGNIADYQKIHDTDEVSGIFQCGTNGACASPALVGLCTPPNGQGFVRCSIDRRFSTTLGAGDGGQNQTQNNWENSAIWNVYTKSISGQNCGPGNYAQTNGIPIQHNNLTDFRCKVDLFRWSDIVEICVQTSYGAVKTDNIWNNNATPTISNVEIIKDEETGISNCTYTFNDGSGDSENTTKTNYSWYISDLLYPDYANQKAISELNTNICCATPYDTVFVTGNEAEVCSGQILKPPLLTWQERRPTWIAGIFAVMALIFLSGGKKNEEE